MLFSSLCFAVGEGPKAIEVKVSVGTADGKQVFVPDHLEFERGHHYKLVLHNPSNEDHYFASDAFATHIHTHKVEVADKSGKTLVEVHGAVHDVELKPGATLEWFFYPMRNGENMKLYCHKADHEEHGMVGTITIFGKPPFSK
ncbi:MAG: biphenyl 2,3-dioxygenase [Gammaproteobacteria bacterium]|nr:biphenyl 2,3-dioxygenase [Gammaproteobacteria bacterium]NIN62157.1 biphenyl 2,3-dioxygenase [Gammaproteobacteria bacterium]NIO61895.1 biphenyl 2,3-dioxygenase [Gammaproteobacteria bacterium]NIP49049.1 biphenyl 2,3-dioxygenase [Gammaproteobacteria bacterium]NIQ09505.1 biphenyl 2,3-dioxygenase [Gammaproteobacteria bacterium]